MSFLGAGAACSESTPSSPEVLPGISLDFEGSSLGSWSRVGSDTIQFSLREDTNASTRYWFSFQVDDAAGRELVFRVSASANMYGAGGWVGKQPVASSDGGLTWTRITNAETIGGFFTFRYRPGSDADRIALTLPYNFSRWLEYLAAIQNDVSVRSVDTIGSSVLGNPVQWVEITSPTGSDSTKAMIWAVARQHPGEPEGSFMMEGFVNWVLGSSPEATQLRTQARILLVGFLNPDGVLAGNQRVNAAGVDLNRQWAAPTAVAAPTVLATQTKMFELEGEGTGVRIVLDFHGAPPTRSNFFIYNDEPAVGVDAFAEMQSLLSHAISTNPDFAPLGNSIARSLGGGERTRSWAYRFLGAHGLTVEGSGVDTPYGPFADQQMTEERYLALGAAVGIAVSQVLFPS